MLTTVPMVRTESSPLIDCALSTGTAAIIDFYFKHPDSTIKSILSLSSFCSAFTHLCVSGCPGQGEGSQDEESVCLFTPPAQRPEWWHEGTQDGETNSFQAIPKRYSLQSLAGCGCCGGSTVAPGGAFAAASDRGTAVRVEDTRCAGTARPEAM